VMFSVSTIFYVYPYMKILFMWVETTNYTAPVEEKIGQCTGMV